MWSLEERYEMFQQTRCEQQNGRSVKELEVNTHELCMLPSVFSTSPVWNTSNEHVQLLNSTFCVQKKKKLDESVSEDT